MRTSPNLTKDVLILTALELNLVDLIGLCQTSKKMNDIICNNQDFWFKKVRKDYDLELESRIGAKQYYLDMEKLLNTNPNHAYRIGINNEALALIKLGLEKGADPNFKGLIDQFTPLIRIIFNDKIFNYLLDKAITSKDTATLNIRDFINSMEYRSVKIKCQFSIKLFDKINPAASEYLKIHKNYWRLALLKLEEINKECPELKDTYNKWIDFYRDLAKD